MRLARAIAARASGWRSRTLIERVASFHRRTQVADEGPGPTSDFRGPRSLHDARGFEQVAERERDVDPPLASLRGCLVGGITAVALSVVAYLLLRDTRLEDWKLLAVAFAAVWTGLGVGSWIALRENRRGLVDSLQLPRTPRGWVRAVLIGVGIAVALRIGSGIVALPWLTDAGLA